MAFEDIRRYIPQREPMLMVDRLVGIDDDGGQTELVVGRGNYFLDRDDCLIEFGLLEHIAQSASAVAGYRVVSQRGGEAPIGMIAEIKKFVCHRLPRLGERLSTTVTFGIEVMGVTLVSGVSKIGDETVAETRMKIFM